MKKEIREANIGHIILQSILDVEGGIGAGKSATSVTGNVLLQVEVAKGRCRVSSASREKEPEN